MSFDICEPAFERLVDAAPRGPSRRPSLCGGETSVTSTLVGEFRYRSNTLEAPGDFEGWLVVQVPDEDSTVRLRQALHALRDGSNVGRQNE